MLLLTSEQSASGARWIAKFARASTHRSLRQLRVAGAEINFKHPIFAPFDDPRYSDFTPIHFWKHRVWEIPTSLNANVLAKFDDGSPALTQIAVGKGNLLVLASGWAPSDSQLAVSSKFPPLMETMLDWSGFRQFRLDFQFRTGDADSIAPFFVVESVQWKNPDAHLAQTLPAGTAFY